MTAGVVTDHCGGNPLIDQVTRQIDPFPIDLVPVSTGSFEGQFHSGAQVHITGSGPLSVMAHLMPRVVPAGLGEDGR